MGPRRARWSDDGTPPTTAATPSRLRSPSSARASRASRRRTISCCGARRVSTTAPPPRPPPPTRAPNVASKAGGGAPVRREGHRRRARPASPRASSTRTRRGERSYGGASRASRPRSRSWPRRRMPRGGSTRGAAVLDDDDGAGPHDRRGESIAWRRGTVRPAKKPQAGSRSRQVRPLERRRRRRRRDAATLRAILPGVAVPDEVEDATLGIDGAVSDEPFDTKEMSSKVGTDGTGASGVGDPRIKGTNARERRAQKRKRRPHRRRAAHSRRRRPRLRSVAVPSVERDQAVGVLDTNPARGHARYSAWNERCVA